MDLAKKQAGCLRSQEATLVTSCLCVEFYLLG